jgi:phage portal protein BeeE
MDAKPDTAGMIVRSVATTAFAQLLRSTRSGPMTQNRFEQLQHFTGIIYVAIRAICDAMQGAQIRVMQPDAKAKPIMRKSYNAGVAKNDQEYADVPDDHPACRLFDYVNPQDTFADLLSHWVVQEELTGNFYLWGNPNRFGQPVELWPVPSSLTTYIPPSPAYPNGLFRVNWLAMGGFSFAGSYGSGTAEIPGEEMYQFKKINPVWRWDGYSPLTAGGVQIDLLESIDESRKAAMERGPNLDVIVTAKGASQEVVDAAVEAIERRHSGARNSRRITGIGGDGGDIEVKGIGSTTRDMDYPSAWSQMRDFALTLFNVPPSVIDSSNSSYSSLYASLKQFRELNLMPRLAGYASFLQKHMVRPHFGENLVVKIDLPELNDPDLLNRRLAGTPGPAVTVNEYRLSYGFQPFEDGDVTMSEFQAARQPKPEPGPEQPSDEATNPLANLKSGGKPGQDKPEQEQEQERDRPEVGADAQGSLPAREQSQAKSFAVRPDFAVYLKSKGYM